MKGSFWVKAANMIIIVFIILMIIALLLLPFLVGKYSELYGMQILNTKLLIGFLYLTALPFTVLLFAARKLCKNTLNKEPFSQSSITALNLISACAFIDFLLYALSTIFILKNLLSLVLMIAAFMVGLTCLILAQLVKYAMEIKQENDLTI